MLRVDPDNPRAQKLHDALRAHVDLTAVSGDLCVVIGGDGWMLQTIREVGTEPIFLGLNAGHVGFLLNEADDVRHVAACLVERRWKAWPFPRLGLEAWPERADASAPAPIRDAAVNDIYVERMSGHTAHLRVTIEGVEVVERLVCDGIVVATALGSTAYSFSAGGPACHPLVETVHLTPICPHAPRLAPITLPRQTLVEVQVIDGAH
ncbi:MAG: hypothetical protein QGG40_14880, partial [Myxococcota bacterium]|nr:hypothetical protein [Myxococcota bacterium]